MDVLNYLASSVPLYSICAIMIFIAFRNLRSHRKESIYFIAFTVIVLLLSIVVFLER